MVSSSDTPSRSRNAKITKQQILDAAETAFSRHGLQGTRISEIARSAGVTTAMIHYYFGNKEGLYKTVLQRPALEAGDLFAQLGLEALPPEEALKTFIKAAIVYEALHPYRGMLWFQEASQNQGEYFKLSIESWSKTFSYLQDILERGMAEGSFRQLDPSFTIVHILGVCIFYFNIHENWKHVVPGVDRLGEQMVQGHIENAIALILAGVKA
ncbi:TetR/AcrR family transcriptional regulator [Lusitaniella coriacea LEGE 07157]|uniref:TetR/AcrR family transcriptional regulator n=1 Tax=Lusitaniella coriacea LEGE 07157 TaxID=945747 RepID=A0A8J7DV92_9CYAN|nr:TetR/AcrR family transcriptional regulator [Lusitaniella coriacea LEGE 07157]